ncbi:MAG: adenosylcobinamide-phosphate synthase CbiB [Pseudomonadota bacterium]|nr:adenosylcobinamide-phosphate synthase CbiB [Pseudomonadota bacterium]
MISLSWPVVTSLTMASGLLLDWSLGEPRRWHPLVGFGNLANRIERRFNTGGGRTWRGALGWGLAVLPLCAVALALTIWVGRHSVLLAAALHALLLYFALGLRSLFDHTRPIERALDAGQLDEARRLTARIVTRDTTQADPEALAKAAVESLLENGNDAVFGTLFWFALGGGSAALLFRLANTLDAMWGYRSERFLQFGCVAARIDDLLNWIPARLTALSYALFGRTGQALRCWRQQAPAWPSPNAGPVMAAGAGALGLALGGAACYDGVNEQRPPLGLGREAQAHDIGRAWRLVAKTTIMWLTITVVIALASDMIFSASGV